MDPAALGAFFAARPQLPQLLVFAVAIAFAFWARAHALRPKTTRGLATKAPGWIARRRARGGIAHKHDRVGVGYRSAVGAVHVDVAALNHHGYIGGAPGSGKTWLLRLLIQGYPGPVIALDTKGSPELAETVWGMPGHVWQFGGPLKLDLLDPEPAILAQQLLEGEIFTDRASVYRAIAEHAVQRAAHVLRWGNEPREPSRILALLSSPSVLADAIRSAAPPNDALAQRWLVELDAPSLTIREGFQTFSERLGTLLDSPAGRSLGAGPDALRLADVVATGGKLLVQLDPRYGALSRKLGAWTLVAMLRLAAELRQAKWQGKCLFVIDEPRVLEHEGRHLANLFGTARDAGLGLVVADWGIAGLSVIHPDLPDAIMRSTAWQVVLRQGSAADAEHIAAQFGTVWREDVSRSSDGRTTSRLREEPRVYASSLLTLPTANGWLRVAPIGTTARERVEHVVFAVPAPVSVPRRLALPPGRGEPPEPQGEPGEPRGSVGGSPDGSPEEPDSEFEVDNTVGNHGASVKEDRDHARRHTEPDLSTRDGRKRALYRHVRVIDGWRRWRGLFDRDGYPRMWGELAHRSIYEIEHGPIPFKWTIDHGCGERDCLDHLEAVTLGENLRRRHARERGELSIGHAWLTPPGQPGAADADAEPDGAADDGRDVGAVEARRAEVRRLRAEGWSVRRIAAQLHVGYGTVRRDVADGNGTGEAVGATAIASMFTIALFERIDRTAVRRETLDINGLRQLLSTFAVLADKHRGRCWSPTRYADGYAARGNAGVESVSCLVFDCDRVPPEWTRLECVCWIAHTTWSHRPDAPRWRVVIPLAQPVASTHWRDIWQRARVALCPEADPACKDPSRAYWLPSRPAGVAPETGYHPGPLLDPRTLPELQREPKGLRMPTPSRAPRNGDRGRGEAYMAQVLDNLATVAPGGRNAALNRAAWTLGRWVTAGALDQADVEDGLYEAAERNGLVADDGQRQCWATIRSGLGAGLNEPVDLDAGRRK